jgi:purine-binding chemotaxis protein CheW
MTSVQSELTQIVTFRLGDDLFAADIFAVERVLRHRPPTPIPNVPDWIDGVIDYQERVVPVIDLRRRFSLAGLEPTSTTRIIVLAVDREWIAVVVDAVLDVSTLDLATLAPPPPLFRGLAGEYIRGILRRADRLVVFLDVNRLLTATERLALAAAGGDPGPNG